MNISVVSYVSDSVAEIFRDIAEDFEKAFRPHFLNDDFGADISEFIIGIAAVDSDVELNNKFCKGNDKVGSRKHWLSQEVAKYMSIALPMDPDKIEKMTKAEVRRAFCEALIEKLKNPVVKIPKKFDYARFVEKMDTALQIYARATFEAV